MARTRKTTTKPTTNAPPPVRADFDTVADFMAWANDPTLSAAGDAAIATNEQEYTTNKRQSRPDFYGLPSATRATTATIEELANAGWTDGAKRTSANAEQITVAPAVSVKRRRIRGDHGDALDIDRLYSGQLDTAWHRVARAASVQPPRIRIVTNMATPGSADAETLFWRGAASLALASRLTQAGYTVQLCTAMAGRFRYYDDAPENNFLFTVTTKDFRDPFNLPSLAASTALAGFFRGLGFLGIIKTATHRITSGLGIPRAIQQSDMPSLPNTRTFLINDNQCATRAAASEWIAAVIQEIEQPTLSAAA